MIATLGILYVLAGFVAIFITVVWVVFPFIVIKKFNRVIELLEKR